MATVTELYELWAGNSDLDSELARSLEPRGTDWLFDLFSSLGPEPGQLVVDVGARDARHTIRLAREHGLRAVAVDPLPQHVERAREAVAAEGLDLEVVEGRVESLPIDNASADWIWCRDVLVHVDVGRGLAECARVLKPGCRMVAYVTVATDLLEPQEATFLTDAVALQCLDGEQIETAAAESGLVQVEKIALGGEWRERMIEAGDWDAGDSLLRLSRLRRQEAELVREHGRTAVNAYIGGQLWGIYQLIGKLAPTVYVWERSV
jgi:SAM-dependent methyltransferase